MPSFGGSLRPRAAFQLRGRNLAAGVALAAAGIVLCTLVSTALYRSPDELYSGGEDALASMQDQVQHQLVEAAKRHARAEKHKTESIKFENAAQQEREKAELLKKRAELAKSEAELENSEHSVHKTRAKVSKLHEESDRLLATSKQDNSKADADKEAVMMLEDKAGALSQKASEEGDKMKVVQSKERKAAASLPKLLKDAEAEEIEASDLKTQAKKRMDDSKRKAAAAKRLDEKAEQKEHDAQMIRDKLMGVLQDRMKVLARKEKDAELDDDLAKKAARAEADKAQEYSAKAVESQQLAKVVSDKSSSAAHTASKKAVPESPEQRRKEQEEAKMIADAESADAADDKDAAHAEKLEMEHDIKKARMQSLTVVAPRDPVAPFGKELFGVHHSREETHAARASNLRRAALETARRRAASRSSRVPQLAVSSTGVDANAEGHYMPRREASFNRALAASYRSGYKGAERHASLRAQTSVKPARLQMLGDASDSLFTDQPRELLSAGAGDSVGLEKEASVSASDSSSGKPRLFSMLWTDPGSLKADTEDLMGTTRHMQRYASHGRGGGGGSSVMATELPQMSTLYENGHESREEDQFKEDMGKYRTALKEEREAHEDKIKHLNQELAQLPAAGRNSGNWKEDREAVFSTMLHQPQSQWASHGQHAYSHTQRAALMAMPSVREDEEGHLVFDRRHRARMQELHEYARRRVRFHDDEGDGEEEGDRGDMVRRVREELARERNRERRLEDVTQRMQGEIDVLKQDRSGPARTQDLVQMRRGGRMGDEGRRRRIEGARGRMMRYHQRAHGGRWGRPRANGEFHPDATYNQEYASDPGHVSVGEIKFQHALKDFDRTKSLLREGAQEDQERFHLPQLVPSHLPGQGL